MDEKDLLIAQLRKENAALRQMIEDLAKTGEESDRGSSFIA